MHDKAFGSRDRTKKKSRVPVVGGASLVVVPAVAWSVVVSQNKIAMHHTCIDLYIKDKCIPAVLLNVWKRQEHVSMVGSDASLDNDGSHKKTRSHGGSTGIELIAVRQK